jgi:hypothetical protein
LTKLLLDSTLVSDAGLEHVKGLTKLTQLVLSGPWRDSRITDAGLTHLRGLRRLTDPSTA